MVCKVVLGLAFYILCLTLYPNNDFKGVCKYCQYPLSTGKYDSNYKEAKGEKNDIFKAKIKF